MATKVKKGYGLSQKEQELRQEALKQDAQNDKQDKKARLLGAGGSNAPIWRRLVAYLIDLALSYGATGLFVVSSIAPDIPMTNRWLLLASAIITQLWFFGIFPGEYTPGQTIGCKMTRIYVRHTKTHRTIGVWKMFFKTYLYGVLGLVLTGPFTLVSLVYQVFVTSKSSVRTTQMLAVKAYNLVLPHDMLFRTEVVYVPQKGKRVEDAARS